MAEKEKKSYQYYFKKIQAPTSAKDLRRLQQQSTQSYIKYEKYDKLKSSSIATSANKSYNYQRPSLPLELQKRGSLYSSGYTPGKYGFNRQHYMSSVDSQKRYTLKSVTPSNAVINQTSISQVSEESKVKEFSPNEQSPKKETQQNKLSYIYQHQRKVTPKQNSKSKQSSLEKYQPVLGHKRLSEGFQGYVSRFESVQLQKKNGQPTNLINKSLSKNDKKIIKQLHTENLVQSIESTSQKKLQQLKTSTFSNNTSYQQQQSVKSDYFSEIQKFKQKLKQQEMKISTLFIVEENNLNTKDQINERDEEFRTVNRVESRTFLNDNTVHRDNVIGEHNKSEKKQQCKNCAQLKDKLAQSQKQIQDLHAKRHHTMQQVYKQHNTIKEYHENENKLKTQISSKIKQIAEKDKQISENEQKLFIMKKERQIQLEEIRQLQQKQMLRLIEQHKSEIKAYEQKVSNCMGTIGELGQKALQMSISYQRQMKNLADEHSKEVMLVKQSLKSQYQKEIQVLNSQHLLKMDQVGKDYKQKLDVMESELRELSLYKNQKVPQLIENIMKLQSELEMLREENKGLTKLIEELKVARNTKALAIITTEYQQSECLSISPSTSPVGNKIIEQSLVVVREKDKDQEEIEKWRKEVGRLQEKLKEMEYNALSQKEMESYRQEIQIKQSVIEELQQQLAESLGIINLLKNQLSPDKKKLRRSSQSSYQNEGNCDYKQNDYEDGNENSQNQNYNKISNNNTNNFDNDSPKKRKNSSSNIKSNSNSANEKTKIIQYEQNNIQKEQQTKPIITKHNKQSPKKETLKNTHQQIIRQYFMKIEEFYNEVLEIFGIDLVHHKMLESQLQNHTGLQNEISPINTPRKRNPSIKKSVVVKHQVDDCVEENVFICRGEKQESDNVNANLTAIEQEETIAATGGGLDDESKQIKSPKQQVPNSAKKQHVALMQTLNLPQPKTEHQNESKNYNNLILDETLQYLTENQEEMLKIINQWIRKLQRQSSSINQYKQKCAFLEQQISQLSFENNTLSLEKLEIYDKYEAFVSKLEAENNILEDKSHMMGQKIVQLEAFVKELEEAINQTNKQCMTKGIMSLEIQKQHTSFGKLIHSKFGTISWQPDTTRIQTFQAYFDEFYHFPTITDRSSQQSQSEIQQSQSLFEKQFKGQKIDSTQQQKLDKHSGMTKSEVIPKDDLQEIAENEEQLQATETKLHEKTENEEKETHLQHMQQIIQTTQSQALPN